jgi:hypothetical protein
MSDYPFQQEEQKSLASSAIQSATPSLTAVLVDPLLMASDSEDDDYSPSEDDGDDAAATDSVMEAAPQTQPLGIPGVVTRAQALQRAAEAQLHGLQLS